MLGWIGMKANPYAGGRPIHTCAEIPSQIRHSNHKIRRPPWGSQACASSRFPCFILLFSLFLPFLKLLPRGPPETPEGEGEVEGSSFIFAVFFQVSSPRK